MTSRVLFVKIYDRMRYYVDKYLSTRIVFFLDLTLSIIASGFILLVANSISRSGDYAGKFVLSYLAVSLVVTLFIMLVHKGYRNAIRHFRSRDMLLYSISSACKSLLIFVAMSVLDKLTALSFDTFIMMWLVVLDAIITMVLMIGLRVSMIVVYNVFTDKLKSEKNLKRILVYRTGEKSISMIQRFSTSTNFKIVGFVTTDNIDRNLRVADLPVYSFSDLDSFRAVISSSGASGILVTSENNLKRSRNMLCRYASNDGIKIYITPSIDEYVSHVNGLNVREINIEDLLGRDEINISLEKINADFSNKTVMVTGAAGSIGSELCRQLSRFGISNLILFDNAETPMHNLRLELEEKFPSLKFVPVIGDVRSLDRLNFVFDRYHPQIVFHAAAYKHVPLMEENPCEAVKVNVMGTRQVADTCIKYGTEKMVMISTDKAVNPTNIMGCTKRLAEIYVQSLGLALERGTLSGNTQFITTRFGNVLGSNGSVIPRFREQIAHGGPVTVTHQEITRFFMTIPEACRLVMEAAVIDDSNKIAVFDMGEPVKIDDLARKMISLSGFVPERDIQIVYTGLRPGEKLYEEVLSNIENTQPTLHDRIRIAKVREYDYHTALNYVERLSELSTRVDIMETVKLMKEIVPEFKSNNSVFEKLDK